MVLAEMNQGQPGELFQARALSERTELPFDTVAKAMQRMAHIGLLRSVQGKYGGYQIAQELRHVSLGTLMEAIMGPSAVTPCLQPGQTCGYTGHCVIRKAMARLDARVHTLFQETPILELIS